MTGGRAYFGPKATRSQVRHCKLSCARYGSFVARIRTDRRDTQPIAELSDEPSRMLSEVVLNVFHKRSWSSLARISRCTVFSAGCLGRLARHGACTILASTAVA